MTAVLLILALDLAMLAHQWHRAIVDDLQLTVVAQSGRIAILTRQLDDVEAPFKARIRALEWVSGSRRANLHKALEDLGARTIERNDWRGEALMWKGLAIAKVGIEHAEFEVEQATERLTRELAAVSS